MRKTVWPILKDFALFCCWTGLGTLNFELKGWFCFLFFCLEVILLILLLEYSVGTLIPLFARKCFDRVVCCSVSHVVSESDTSLFSSSGLKSLAAALKTRRFSSEDKKSQLVML